MRICLDRTGASRASRSRRSEMARYADGLKVATCLFEAAAWGYAIKASCRCGHFALFNAHGLWWHFHRRGFDDDLRRAREKLWCRPCRQRISQKVRPRALELVRPEQQMINLPMPDEREWKRIIGRFRG